MWVGRHQNGLLWEHPLFPMSPSILPRAGCRSGHGWHVPAWCPRHLGQPRLAGGGGDMVQLHRPGLSPPLQFGVSPHVWLSPVQPPCPLHRWGSGVMGCVSPGGWWHLCPPPAPPPVRAQVTGDRGRGGTWATLALGSGTTAMGSLLWVPLRGSEWPQPLPHSQPL